jgi:hypothetical protein
MVMKKLYTIFVLIFVSFLMNVSYAQTNLGVIGGVNLANFDIEDGEDEIDLSSRTTFGFGGIFELNFGENVSLVFQPMYLQKGAKTTFEETDPFIGTIKIDGSFKIAYLELPALLKVALGTGSARPYLLAGPSVGFNLSSKLSASSEIDDLSFEIETDIDEIIESIDFGFQFGGGIMFPLGNNTIFFEGKYALGLSDILKDGTIDLEDEETEFEGKLKTKGILIMGGISIPLGAQ